YYRNRWKEAWTNCRNSFPAPRPWLGASRSPLAAPRSNATECRILHTRVSQPSSCRQSILSCCNSNKRVQDRVNAHHEREDGRRAGCDGEIDRGWCPVHLE